MDTLGDGTLAEDQGLGCKLEVAERSVPGGGREGRSKDAQAGHTAVDLQDGLLEQLRRFRRECQRRSLWPLVWLVGCDRGGGSVPEGAVSCGRSYSSSCNVRKQATRHVDWPF